ncbi:hypothetical protein [Anaeromicrobium sediminis]|nr:hypothetical protein [Anaeromicrobium sediminis]
MKFHLSVKCIIISEKYAFSSIVHKCMINKDDSMYKEEVVLLIDDS